MILYIEIGIYFGNSMNLIGMNGVVCYGIWLNVVSRMWVNMFECVVLLSFRIVLCVWIMCGVCLLLLVVFSVKYVFMLYDMFGVLLMYRF